MGATAKFCSECGTPPARAAQSAEYKQVTVLFADVVHSMDIARLLGAERLREIMAELVDCASSVVQRFGGTVGSFTGDGIMAVLGAPTALEDHSIRACLAALAIQEEAGQLAAEVTARDGVELRLRVGLNSGQVIAGEIGSGPFGYTTVGEHVGMAQRMESVAPPGEVMLSASTARLVDGTATLAEPELVQIKGADDPVPARLLGVGQQHPDVRRAESNLVGGRWEMFAVEGLLDRVAELLGPDLSVEELRQTIAERAAGTPFFAEEIVRELAERGVLQGSPAAYFSTGVAAGVTVPATLQATIAARIDRLDPKAKRTLSAAAVVGSRFGSTLLTELGIEPLVADLLAAQLVDQVTFTGNPEYVFHHPLIRAVAYETQLKSDRADLHRRVAAAIEQHSAGSPDENAALIAEHLETAGDLHAAFDWHMRAGAWSINRDNVAARVSWERARQVADELPDDHPNRTAMRIAPRTTLCATDWRVHADDSDVHFEELRELCALAGDKISLAFSLQGSIAEHMFRGEMCEATRLASEQMALLESIGDPSLTAQAAFGAAGVKAQTGQMADVLRWSEATVAWAGDDPAKGNLVVGSPLAAALYYRGPARWWFGRPGWREDLGRALAIAEAADPLTLAVVASWNVVGIMNGVLRADDAAAETIENTLRIAEASGDNYAVGMAKSDVAFVLLWRGNAADRQRALALAADVRTMCLQRAYPMSELPAMDSQLARERARRGDHDGAIPAMRKSVDDLFTQGQLLYCSSATANLVETLLDRGADGDVAEAEAAIARLAAAPADGSVNRDVWLLRMHALLAVAQGDDAGYRDLRDRYRALATSLGFEGHMARAEAMS